MKRIFLITLIAAMFFPGCQNKLVSIDDTANTKSPTSIVSRAHWITVHIRNDETFTMLYEFFKDELQLPVFFHPEKWGGARYTAILAGNVVFEVCGPYPKTPIPGTELMARCNTLIFRPFESAQASADELARRRINYEGPSKSDLQSVNVFDLGMPVNISATKEQGKDSKIDSLRNDLKSRNGGPIGLKNVKELYIGYNSKEHLDRWINFIKPAKHKKNLWYLPEEPNLRFVEDESERIRAIVFKVESFKKATDYLKRKDILGDQTKKSVEITKTKTGGLRIILEE
ncbi:MAG: hypothetical protein ACYSWW_13520 [Planctomycetota bacterium]|jgi:hypothetical protein